MNNIWVWILSIGSGIIFSYNVVNASIKLARYMKYGKQNAESYFEKRVREIAARVYKELFKIDIERCERDSKSIKEFFTSELRPIKDDITSIKDVQEKTRSALVSDLKIKLRDLYNGAFKRKGMLTNLEKSKWDEYYTEYTNLGGNGDIKIMNKEIQDIQTKEDYKKQKVDLA